MMCKKLRLCFSLVCFLLVGLNLHAQRPSLEKAQALAEEFFQQNHPSARYRTRAAGPSGPIEVWNSCSLREGQAVRTLSVADEEPTFYLFANPDGPGFALISGDEVARPLLGYSFEEKASRIDELPDNLREYLLGVDEQIKAQRARADRQPQTYHSVATGTQTSPGKVKVLLETALWGQYAPFNDLCYNPQGQKSLTGCVPTAYAIVLRYHEWPLSGHGTVRNNGRWGTTDRDISGNDYDWNQMPLTYESGQYTPAQAAQVAQLMYDMGCACQVDYGTGVTGGNPSSQMLASVQEHFGYKNGQFKKKDLGEYTDAQWMAAIRADLDAGRPIPYAATRNRNAGGADAKHMFVIDGYTDRDYVHVNWGWNGSGNGFYALTDMTPNDAGSYVLNHIAHFNFTPDRKDVCQISVTAQGQGAVYLGNAQGTTTRQVVKGTGIVLHAVPAVGYEFAHWTRNGQVVSQSADYSVSVDETALYTANFVKNGETATGTWYYVKFLQSGLYLTAPTVNGTLSALPKDGVNAPAQLWEFVEKGGQYEVRNQNNVYLCISSSVSGAGTRRVESAQVYLDYSPGTKKFRKEKWNNNGGGERIYFYGDINDWPLSVLPDGQVALVKSNEGANLNIVLEKADFQSPDVPQPPVTRKHHVQLTGNAGTKVLLSAAGQPLAPGAEVVAGTDVLLTFTLRPTEEAVVSVGTQAPVIVTGTTYLIQNIQSDVTINVNVRQKEEPQVTLRVRQTGDGLAYIGDSQTTQTLKVRKGTTVTLHAVTLNGSTFTGWTSNLSTSVIPSADYTFQAEQDAEFMASFAAPVLRHPVSLSVNGGTGSMWLKNATGSSTRIDNGTAVEAGSDIELRFGLVGEQQAEIQISGRETVTVRENSYLVKDIQSETLICVTIFTPAPAQVQLAVSTTGNGTVWMGHSMTSTQVVAEAGSSVTLHALPAEGYDFAGWTLHGQTVSTAADYTVCATEDAVYQAVFIRQQTPAVTGDWYYIKFLKTQTVLTAVNAAYGELSAQPRSDTQASAQLWQLVEKDGMYEIKNLDGIYLCISSSVSGSGYRRQESAYVYLDYQPSAQKFSKENWRSNGGGERIYFYGEINDWPLSVLDNGLVGLVQSNNASNINIVLEKADVLPEQQPVTPPAVIRHHVSLTGNAGTRVMLSVQGEVQPWETDVPAGTDLKLNFSLSADEQAEVRVNGQSVHVSGTTCLIPNVQSDVTVDVQIRKLVRITVQSSAQGYAHIGDATQTAVQVVQGTSLTLQAHPAEGYEFAHWLLDGQVVEGAEASYTIVAERDAAYVAEFTEKPVGPVLDYYAIRFCERRSLLTDNGNGTVSARPESAPMAEQQLWAFLPVEGQSGKFYLQSKSGHYLVLAARRGDAAMTTADPGQADVFYALHTADYDRWQHPAYAGSYLLVKDHSSRYCLEESADYPGKVIGYNQPWEYTELQFELREQASASAFGFAAENAWGLRGGSPEPTGIGETLTSPGKDHPIYDLQGRQVRQTVPGRIYIQNGMKFIAQ